VYPICALFALRFGNATLTYRITLTLSLTACRVVDTKEGTSSPYRATVATPVLSYSWLDSDSTLTPFACLSSIKHIEAR